MFAPLLRLTGLGRSWPTFTPEEIESHHTAESLWIVAGNSVYDVTPLVGEHPGGDGALLRRGGGTKDCTEDFQFHSRTARIDVKNYKIGIVDPRFTFDFAAVARRRAEATARAAAAAKLGANGSTTVAVSPVPAPAAPSSGLTNANDDDDDSTDHRHHHHSGDGNSSISYHASTSPSLLHSVVPHSSPEPDGFSVGGGSSVGYVLNEHEASPQADHVEGHDGRCAATAKSMLVHHDFRLAVSPVRGRMTEDG